MKKTTLILSLATMMCAGTAKADNYFFSVNGAGDQDGSTWENAAPSEYLGGLLVDLKPGDAVYLQGGQYLPDRNTGLWEIPQGIILKGGYAPDMKGTETAITYPTQYETIFTADIDGDGVGDNGGKAFITIKNEMTEEWKGEKTYADYQKTTIAGITIRDSKYTSDSYYHGGAVCAMHATLEFDHVNFINNYIACPGGNVLLQGCYAEFHDCIFRDNKGQSSGVALLARQHNGGSGEGETRVGVTILDRCEFVNNTAEHPELSGNKDGMIAARYGGALALADWGGTMYINNTTVTGSHINVAGGMGRFGTGTTIYMSNNTFFDCTCALDSRTQGHIISCGSKTKVYTVNTISVNKTDGLEEPMETNDIQDSQCTLDTRGYNVWGSVRNNSGTPFADTDNVNKDNTMAVVFGTNVPETVDGRYVIAPLESFRTVPVADLKAAAEAWQLPACIDLTVDQTGKIRPATTVPGAYDSKATSGISDVAVPAVLNVSDDVYNLQGVRVAARADMNNLPAGLYICGGKKYVVK